MPLLSPHTCFRCSGLHCVGIPGRPGSQYATPFEAPFSVVAIWRSLVLSFQQGWDARAARASSLPAMHGLEELMASYLPGASPEEPTLTLSATVETRRCRVPSFTAMYR